MQPKPNRWAFAITIPLGVLMVFVLAAIQIPRSTEPASFVLGQASAWGMMPAVAVALLVFFLPNRVPWWLYGPAVIVGAAGLFVLSSFGPNAEPTASGRTEERAGLQLPATSGDWQLDRSEATKRHFEAQKTRARSELGDDVTIVAGQYLHGDDHTRRMGFSGVVTQPGTGLDDEIKDSPSRATRNYMAGAGFDDIDYFDAGPQGGALACGKGSTGQAKGVVMCTFTAAGRQGTTAFTPGTVTVEEAAELTREFRADVEIPG
ncbi:hypothetical protein [Nocardioides speluncae]|uniref:hypothetical protein n=1 Tax=Nocardioides speluncae TaxID=2670337 RepID=UPI0012B1778E|nr:hypothetical protein [Nocardioides speluncae]